MSEFYDYDNFVEKSDDCSYNDLFELSNDAEEFNKLIRKEEIKKFVLEYIEEYNNLENKINELNFEDYFSENNL